MIVYRNSAPAVIHLLQMIPFSGLIGGPLIARIESDSLSSQRYLDYLMKIVFQSYDPATGRTGKISMLTFF